VEENILGVIEIASFKNFEQHEIEFLEKIAESIASTIISVRINERTNNLLNQSQRQAAEMAEQEEEMRQNMEELQATQEEFGRREKEINSIQDAIKNSVIYVEYDLKGTILDINDHLLELSETQKEDAVGLHHSEFFSLNRNLESYNMLWDDLNKGRTVSKEERLRLFNNKEIWLSQNYAPVFNDRNVVEKVISLAIDITETKHKELALDRRTREIARKDNEMEYLISAIDDAIIKCEFSPDGTIIKGNDHYARMMGIALHDLVGKQVDTFISEREEKDKFKTIWAGLLQGTSHKEVLRRTRPDRDVRWIISTFTPVKDERGEIYKIYFLGQDTTKEQMRFDLLVEANKEIERLNKLLEGKT
jgi:methyl-accepting chemotaxis protein